MIQNYFCKPEVRSLKLYMIFSTSITQKDIISYETKEDIDSGYNHSYN